MLGADALDDRASDVRQRLEDLGYVITNLTIYTNYLH
jgi:hypothetical protein